MTKLSKKNKFLIEGYKREFDFLITNNGAKGISLDEAILSIKTVLEKTITGLGENGKTALIRSQKPIKLIHEAVKASLINSGIHPDRVKPKLGSSAEELKLTGFLKMKNQDICVVPNGFKEVPETIVTGLLVGKSDKLGLKMTENIISINVRSQLSSLGQNIDTLYERTFAEALNLHMRCPKMCLGEVYMIPVYEYNKHSAQKRKVEWVKAMTPVETYINAFNAISNRVSTTDEFYKYEKICLLIVDFSKVVPKIYDTDDELKKDGIIAPNSTASIQHLSFLNFVTELIKVYKTRFPANTFN